MGIIDSAGPPVGRHYAAGVMTLALACLLTGCAHAPRLAAYRDALAPEEHMRLGTAYEAQGLRAEALSQYKAAVLRSAGCAECWLAIGNIEFTDGRLTEAEAAFRKALKASPHHPGAANNLAMAVLERNGGLPEAEALALDALEHAGPLRVYILDTLANIYLREGRYAEAAAAADQAEAAAPAEDSRVRGQLQATRASIAASVKVTHNLISN